MSKPSAFPDASIGGNMEQYENLFDEIFNGHNVNSALKAAVGAGVKLLPAVGSLLSGLVTALWPNPTKDKGLFWKDIESKVEVVASGLINRNNSEQMRNVTEGLYNVMKLYLDQAPNTVEKGQYFTSILVTLAQYQPLYFNDKAPWDNLAYFASVGTLHLTVLREQHLFYSEIYGHEDSQAAKHKQDLEDAVQKYLTARNMIISKCIEWHRTQITVDQRKKDSGYWNTNELYYKDPVRNLDEYFHWSENDNFIGSKKFTCRKRQIETWVATGYRSQVEALLSPSFSWPLYSPSPREGLAIENPANVVEGQVADNTVRRLMMDYPGWIGDGTIQSMPTDEPYYFDHEAMFKEHGPITKIIVHAGDRIDGLEIFYGGHAAPVRGKIGGNQHEALELRAGEMITGLWAGVWRNSEYISALKLTSSVESGAVGQTIQAGGADTIARLGWEYSFDGHEGGLQNEGTKRLLWFSGWSMASGSSGYIFRLLPVFGHYQTWGPLQ